MVERMGRRKALKIGFSATLAAAALAAGIPKTGFAQTEGQPGTGTTGGTGGFRVGKKSAPGEGGGPGTAGNGGTGDFKKAQGGQGAGVTFGGIGGPSATRPGGLGG